MNLRYLYDSEENIFLPNPKIYHKVNNKKEIIFVFDLLGRRIIRPKQLQIYVAKYSDGSSELIQWKKSYRLKK